MNAFLHLLLIAILACGNVQLFQPPTGGVPVTEERSEERAEHGADAVSAAVLPAGRVPSPARTVVVARGLTPRLARPHPADARPAPLARCARLPLRC